jgi:uncharacterized protein with PIN domain
MVEKFLADAMLGKLAKWLRIMGYDVLYRSCCNPGQIQSLICEGRTLLTRNTRLVAGREGVAFIVSDHVDEQLRQMRAEGVIEVDHAKWFTRCLLCNEVLQEVPAESARENVPEYIFFQHPTEIRFCPSCGRFFWPGTQRQRMVMQLKAWGL